VAIDRALAGRALRREVGLLRSATAADAPAGVSAAWRRVVAMVEAAAGADSTLLLTGESGTGKELLARLAHRMSPRASGPYVRVNCAAVPLDVWESEFFGHRKGSFTGAGVDREGRFQLADRGTLFLDEVGAMPLGGQAKLLRVIQDGEFDRLGDERPTRVDVRIVAATNSDLAAEVAAHRFRSDLYYRLNVVRIEVPPLRERPEDVPLLVEHFLAKFSTVYGKTLRGVQPSAMQRMLAMPWPGNVRQLENFLEQAVVLADSDILTERDLFGGQRAGAAPSAGLGGHYEPGLPLREVERRHILRTLQKVRGNRTEAAKLLEISVRCLQYKLKAYAEEERAAVDLS
jgi:DNA-binding NtrC family response regulator